MSYIQSDFSLSFVSRLPASRVFDDFFENWQGDVLEQLGLLPVDADLQQAVPVLPHEHSLLVVEQVDCHVSVSSVFCCLPRRVLVETLDEDVGSLLLDKILTDLQIIIPGRNVQRRVAARDLGLNRDAGLLHEHRH